MLEMVTYQTVGAVLGLCLAYVILRYITVGREMKLKRARSEFEQRQREVISRHQKNMEEFLPEGFKESNRIEEQPGELEDVIDKMLKDAGVIKKPIMEMTTDEVIASFGVEEIERMIRRGQLGTNARHIKRRVGGK